MRLCVWTDDVCGCYYGSFRTPLASGSSPLFLLSTLIVSLFFALRFWLSVDLEECVVVKLATNRVCGIEKVVPYLTRASAGASFSLTYR